MWMGRGGLCMLLSDAVWFKGLEVKVMFQD